MATTETAKVSKRVRRFLIVAGSLGGGLVLALFTIGLVFDGYTMPSGANAPTLVPGDRVLARGISGEDVSRGDVVIYIVADNPEFSPMKRIGRVVAVAGDEIGEDGELLTINGELADEPWLPAGMTTFAIQDQVVPDGHVFVMGDNRPNSQDSRFFGPIPHEDVLQLVVVKWWPLGEFGGL